MLARMYAAGLAACRSSWGTLLAIYGVNAAFGATYLVFAGLFLSMQLSARPLFDRAVDGDLAALGAVIVETRGLVPALAAAAIAAALAYFVASQALAGGLLERLRAGPVGAAEARRRFGAGASAHLGRFLRLWLWSLLLWLPALVLGGFGLAGGTSGLREATSADQVLPGLLASITPGVLVALVASTTGDVARCLLVADPRLSPRRAFFTALRHVGTHPVPVVHVISYLAAWLLASGLYVLVTFGHGFAGAGGALVLLVLRQLLVLVRVALRVATFAGQKAYVEATLAAPAPPERPV